MKKYILPLLSLLFLASCSDDVVIEAPSIQGATNTGYFYSTDVTAYQSEDGSISIQGKKGAKVLTLTTNAANAGSTYHFGVDLKNTASFKTLDSLVYATDTTGSGQLKIEAIHNNMISGNFHFSARVNGNSGDTLYFSQGAFYNIPITNGEAPSDSIAPPPVTTACAQAVTNAATAAEAYAQAQESGSAADIATACLAYREALLVQIDACGDESGFLQITLDGLDCNQNN